MSVAVVTQQELDAVLAELAELRERVAAVEGSAVAPDRDDMTADEVAKHFSIRRKLVAAALRDGHLKAKKILRGNAPPKWRIALYDARRWRDRFFPGVSNQ